jgi:hypothetical protein
MNSGINKSILFYSILFYSIIFYSKPRDIPRFYTNSQYIACICKLLGIDSEESIPPAYLAWQADTTNRVVVPSRQAGNRCLDRLKRFTNTGSAQ